MALLYCPPSYCLLPSLPEDSWVLSPTDHGVSKCDLWPMTQSIWKVVKMQIPAYLDSFRAGLCTCILTHSRGSDVYCGMRETETPALRCLPKVEWKVICSTCQARCPTCELTLGCSFSTMASDWWTPKKGWAISTPFLGLLRSESHHLCQTNRCDPSHNFKWSWIEVMLSFGAI